jgi:hypothetical protein
MGAGYRPPVRVVLLGAGLAPSLEDGTRPAAQHVGEFEKDRVAEVKEP